MNEITCDLNDYGTSEPLSQKKKRNINTLFDFNFFGNI